MIKGPKPPSGETLLSLAYLWLCRGWVFEGTFKVLRSVSLTDFMLRSTLLFKFPVLGEVSFFFASVAALYSFVSL